MPESEQIMIKDMGYIDRHTWISADMIKDM